MSNDTLFHDEESRFKSIWGPIALELRDTMHLLHSPRVRAAVRDNNEFLRYLKDGKRPLTVPEITRNIMTPGSQMAMMGRMTMPSREFLVTQAVLNALQMHFPSHIKQLGSASAMRHAVDILGWEHRPVSRWFVRDVIDQFNVLVAQYA